jgi:Flp pilus assembly protein TadD
LERCRKTLELDPTFSTAQAHLAWLLARTGRYGDAITEVQKCCSLPGADLRAKCTLGLVYANAGRAEEARKIAEELESQREPGAVVALDCIYAALGDRDHAFWWLEEAYKESVSNLVFISDAPAFDNLHGDPRFDDLLRRIGLRPTAVTL